MGSLDVVRARNKNAGVIRDDARAVGGRSEMRVKDPDPGDPREPRVDGEGEDDKVIFAAEDATVANAPQTPRPILAAVDVVVEVAEEEEEEGGGDEEEEVVVVEVDDDEEVEVDEDEEVEVDDDDEEEEEEEEEEESFESFVREIERRWRTKARR